MSERDSKLTNRPSLALHVPEPALRPGDAPDFSRVDVSAPGAAARPDVAAAASDTHPLTTQLVRVLGDDHQASGPWDPKLDPDTLRKMLTDMVIFASFLIYSVLSVAVFKMKRNGTIKTISYLKNSKPNYGFIQSLQDQTMKNVST